MEYGKLVKRAWHITWKYKVLWLFGILAALFGGQAGGRFGNNLQYTFNQQDVTRWGDFWRRFAQQGRWDWGDMPYRMMPNLQNLPGWLLALLGVIGIIAFVVGIVSILLRYTSLGALIGGVDDVEQAQAISFKAGFRRGWARLLRLFAINLLLGLAALAAVLVIGLAITLGGLIAAGPLLLIGVNSGALTALGVIWAILLGLVVVVVLIAAIIALSGAVTVVREYAFRACVLELKGVGESIRSAVALLKARFRESLLAWLILAGINLALALIAVPISLLGAGGALVPPLAMLGSTRSTPAAIAVAVPLFLLAAAVSAFIGGLYLTFQSALWTLVYREIKSPEAEVISA